LIFFVFNVYFSYKHCIVSQELIKRRVEQAMKDNDFGKDILGGLRKKSELESLLSVLRQKSPQDILRWALEFFGTKNIAFASSLGAEDQALTDMLVKIDRSAQIFSLDTGRLPQETYDTIAATEKKYGIMIELLFPDTQEVAEMVNEHGPNLFYDSVEKRKLCCEIRKINPLRRKLKTLDAWVCGLRREHGEARARVEPLEWDENFSLFKVNPLFEWTEGEVWKYIKDNGIPYNPLHNKNYPSIGCLPCTRAIAHGEHIRSGRWWWENDCKKECGLHLSNGKLKREEK
jgi:phosphoadenosine phosphosulfate reductase